MSLHGHPGKFTYCIAEDEENSPFPGLHTSFGYEADQSAVIITGAEAPHSTMFSGDADDPRFDRLPSQRHIHGHGESRK